MKDESSTRALVVGIEKYGSVESATGAVTDATAWRDLLVDTYAVDPASIRVITDRRATRSNIRARIDWLYEGTCDNRIFVFAGHGLEYRARTAEGELEPHTEEVLLCHGYATTDDDESAMLRFDDVVRSSPLTLVLDACYSGGFHQPAPPPAARRFQPTADYEHRLLGAGNVRRFSSRSGSAGRTAPLLVAAARADEACYSDHVGPGPKRGLFSYFCIDEWKARPRATPEQVIEVVRNKLASLILRNYGPNYRQTPELAGPRQHQSGLLEQRRT